MHILVIGKNGQLAQALAHNQIEEIKLSFAGRKQCNIHKESEIIDLLNKQQPDLIINAAAYSNVDLAETERKLAYATNVLGPRYLAHQCAKRQIPFIHISSDYVFAGASSSAYSEIAKTNPINFYGKTKAKAEAEILAICPYSMIIRTAWIYSAYGKNFAKTIWQLCKSQSELRIVNDQWGTPTSADFLAEYLLKIARAILSGQSKNWPGIFHLVPHGRSNWAQFGQKIANGFYDYYGKKPKIIEVTSQSYGAKAVRPPYSLLDNQKIERYFNIKLKAWFDLLPSVLEQLYLQENTGLN